MFPVPFCFAIPSLDNTSFTSPFCRFDFRDGDKLRGVRKSPPVMVEARSKVETKDDALQRLGLDIAARPSRASRRSVTPRPRVPLDRLCIDMFSFFISAGDILSRGDTVSGRPPESRGFAFSTSAGWHSVTVRFELLVDTHNDEVPVVHPTALKVAGRAFLLGYQTPLRYSGTSPTGQLLFGN